MKMTRVASFQKLLRKRLGDDLLYSLILDSNNQFTLIVSAHESKTRENKNKLTRCVLTADDLNKEVLTLVNQIAIIYEGHFIEKKAENNEIGRDNDASGN